MTLKAGGLICEIIGGGAVKEAPAVSGIVPPDESSRFSILLLPLPGEAFESPVKFLLALMPCGRERTRLTLIPDTQGQRFLDRC